MFTNTPDHPWCQAVSCDRPHLSTDLAHHSLLQHLEPASGTPLHTHTHLDLGAHTAPITHGLDWAGALDWGKGRGLTTYQCPEITLISCYQIKINWGGGALFFIILLLIFRYVHMYLSIPSELHVGPYI